MSVMCLVFLLPLDPNDGIPTVSRCVVWFEVFIIDTVLYCFYHRCDTGNGYSGNASEGGVCYCKWHRAIQRKFQLSVVEPN